MADTMAAKVVMDVVLRNVEKSVDESNMLAMDLAIHGFDAKVNEIVRANDVRTLKSAAAHGLKATREINRLIYGMQIC